MIYYIGLPWLLLGLAALAQVLGVWSLPTDVYAVLVLALLAMDVIYFVITTAYEYGE